MSKKPTKKQPRKVADRGDANIAAPLQPLVVPIEQLIPDPANVRAHGDRNLAAIASSLARFGQLKPLVVQRKGMIVRAGNGTLLAAKKLGWTQLAANVVDMTDTEATAFAIADNRTAELAEWQNKELLEQLQALESDDPELRAATGFMDEDLRKLASQLAADLADDNCEVELPDVATTRPGDIWKLGPHLVLCGDSTDEAAVSRLKIDDAFLMITDPPYGVAYDPEWRPEEGINNSKRVGKVQNDDRVDWTLAYKLFPGPVAYVWHSGRFAGQVAAHMEATGLEIRAQIVWRKNRFAISRGAYHWQHESCWYAVRKGQASKWCGDRSQSTVWDIDSSGKDQDEQTVHGTQKPLECMGRPMRNHGGEGDMVYDPFLGSGTTLIACHKQKRVCRGVEIDPRYVDVIVLRWQKVSGEKATLLGDGRAFDDLIGRGR